MDEPISGFIVIPHKRYCTGSPQRKLLLFYIRASLIESVEFNCTEQFYTIQIECVNDSGYKFEYRQRDKSLWVEAMRNIDEALRIPHISHISHIYCKAADPTEAPDLEV